MDNERLGHLKYLDNIATVDAQVTTITDTEYDASWKQRGGTGAFHVLARKWDRLEAACRKLSYDIFATIAQDARPEGALDDIRDLRRYLLLVEAELQRVYPACRTLTARDQDALKKYAILMGADDDGPANGPVTEAELAGAQPVTPLKIDFIGRYAERHEAELRGLRVASRAVEILKTYGASNSVVQQWLRERGLDRRMMSRFDRDRRQTVTVLDPGDDKRFKHRRAVP